MIQREEFDLSPDLFKIARIEVEHGKGANCPHLRTHEWSQETELQHSTFPSHESRPSSSLFRSLNAAIMNHATVPPWFRIVDIRICKRNRERKMGRDFSPSFTLIERVIRSRMARMVPSLLLCTFPTRPISSRIDYPHFNVTFSKLPFSSDSSFQERDGWLRNGLY